MQLAETLPLLLALAWLMPLASFALIVLFGPRMGKAGVLAGYVATGAILTSMVLSLVSLGLWVSEHGFAEQHHADASHAAAHADESHGEQAAEPATAHAPAEHAAEKAYYAGDWYALGVFGPLRITIGYYIDALTVAMFVMVTLIATCIHFYANGYMHDELHDVTDHEVILADGHHLHRKGRFHRFFQYMSLFCFSMLGLVIAGNIAMVFVFWELVGICSYFLIGFYIERHSASTAANKAFIVNRIGDFGMIVGLMILFGTLGTFAFGDAKTDAGVEQGIFSLVRPTESNHALTVPDGMVKASAAQEIAAGIKPSNEQIARWRQQGYGYWLLVLAGLGIFCGCVGKSAQFPLHVWLPDAMEGPTPVSALVHSATMVAAGVYLVGRFYPVFAPEVLLTIAIIGGITLFLAATIAITATDIKRVLAYSTVSQLGYMMLALGVGGWLAGVLHLLTHAFFKSLLFLCSGSVIHACHTNEMPKMGGLRHKMPWTAYTMLVGCLAIAGAGIPFVIGFSGYYSKDAILAQALSFARQPGNILHTWLFYVAAAGAAITAFYMFRLWYMTFAGQPRDHHIYEHAHESPKVMYVPLVILAVFAVCVAWPFPGGVSLGNLLETARAPGTAGAAADGLLLSRLVVPSEHQTHLDEDIHVQATLVASATALAGFILATMFYGLRTLNPDDVRRQFSPIYRWLINKWYFDELYHAIFVRPTLLLSEAVAAIDRRLIDRLIDNLARWTRGLSDVDDLIDRYFVDGAVNLTANWLYSLAVWLRRFQTGQLRQYVMFIVVGTVAIFAAVSLLMGFASAGV
ncbi:MAG: NADH-quinone oxidoreductase subunit L [Planctomycetes bacterium]|nr:NADH-quinone oxidoreductase subunit L [Planctomycetota bacterium]